MNLGTYFIQELTKYENEDCQASWRTEPEYKTGLLCEVICAVCAVCASEEQGNRQSVHKQYLCCSEKQNALHYEMIPSVQVKGDYF
jgi:hypothetical protein